MITTLQNRLRGTSALQHLRSLDLSTEEEQEIAFTTWHLEMAERIVDEQFESAWHCVQAGALGESVFTGPDRLCRGHLEGLPVGAPLICSPAGVLGLVLVLYHEMSKRGVFPKSLNPYKTYPTWTFDCGNGKSIELLTPGHRIARILHRQHTLHACIAAVKAYAIADWANNHRRFASTV